MVLATVLVQIARWCFLGCVVTSITFIVQHAAKINYFEEGREPLVYDVQSFSQQDLLEDMLDPDFAQCIQFPSKIFCSTMSNNPKIKETNFFRSSAHTQQDDVLEIFQRHPVHATLYNYSRMMWDLRVETMLLEPSMLFCMLSDEKKIELQMKGFDILNNLGVENIINIAILGSNSSILDLPSTSSVIRLHGFRHLRINIMFEGLAQYPGKENLTVHHFFEKRQIVIHAVVLFEKGNYLWHSGIPHQLPDYLKGHDLSMLFGSKDSIYEKMQSSTLQNDPTIPIGLKIPSNPDEFLLQIGSSKYINCKTKPTGEKSKIQRNNSTKNLKLIFKTAFQELKTRFRRLIMKLFIFGDTLLDWYRNCGLMGESDTRSFDFAVWAIDAAETGDPSLIKELKDSKHLTLTHSLGWPDESREFRFDCQGIRIRLWYMYRENIFWIGRHYKKKKRYYVRHEYPKFKLCSGDFLGYKVQIPCEPEIIFQEDYGTNWRNVNFSDKRIHSDAKRKVFY